MAATKVKIFGMDAFGEVSGDSVNLPWAYTIEGANIAFVFKNAITGSNVKTLWGFTEHNSDMGIRFYIPKFMQLIAVMATEVHFHDNPIVKSTAKNGVLTGTDYRTTWQIMSPRRFAVNVKNKDPKKDIIDDISGSQANSLTSLYDANELMELRSTIKLAKEDESIKPSPGRRRGEYSVEWFADMLLIRTRKEITGRSHDLCGRPFYLGAKGSKWLGEVNWRADWGDSLYGIAIHTMNLQQIIPDEAVTGAIRLQNAKYKAIAARYEALSLKRLREAVTGASTGEAAAMSVPQFTDIARALFSGKNNSGGGDEKKDKKKD